jgi:iron(III) transport system permease protein
VVMCRFPGRRIFEWALLIPLAMPAYITAYAYVDVLEYAGPVQESLRTLFGWGSARDYWFPEIRTLPGAALVMSFVFYPYVYMLARTAFLNQSICVLDVSRILGHGPWSMFFNVALPLARPAIVVGMTMVMMETLNDFGTVDYFAVRTLTAGIYDTWLSMGNLGGSAQIASVMLFFVLALIGLERAGRHRQRFHPTSSKFREIEGFELQGFAKLCAFGICFVTICLGFLIPAGILLNHAIVHFEDSWTNDFFVFAGNSLTLSFLAGACAVAVGLLMAYGQRLSGGPALMIASRLASIGYAIPGAVLGIGVLIPFATFDNRLDQFMRDTFDISTGLLLSGTMVALIFAYVVRFLAVSLGALETGLARVTPHMEMAARTLGMGPLQTLRQVHLPMMKGSLLTALILVFVDSMKELPATLLLRPFNFETLATHVYTSASLGLLEESALAALSIVTAGLIPVIMLNRTLSRARPGHSEPST